MAMVTHVLSLFLALTSISTSAATKQRGGLFEDVTRKEVIFNDDLLFQSSVRSVMDCASRCTLDAKCLTFTYVKGNCRGHLSPVTSLTSTTSQLGARTFVRSESPSDLTASTTAASLTSAISTEESMHQEQTKEYCSTYENGWLLIQRRRDGKENFQRPWLDYIIGFGSYCKDFWGGLEKIHMRTATGKWTLAVEMESWEGERAVAYYDNFSLGARDTNYKLFANSYRSDSTAGNALQCHEGQAFSTMDQGLTDLAVIHDTYSGWWFNENCFGSNLNGVFYTNNPAPDRSGITWTTFKNSSYSLKFVQMKVIGVR